MNNSNIKLFHSPLAIINPINFKRILKWLINIINLRLVYIIKKYKTVYRKIVLRRLNKILKKHPQFLPIEDFKQ